MSDDLTISSGGAVGVDPDSVRSAAESLEALRTELDLAAADLDTVVTLMGAAVPTATRAVGDAARLRDDMEAASWDARTMVERLRTVAAAYDLVELTVQRDLATRSGGHTALAWLDAEIARLEREYPDAARLAAAALDEHEHAGEVAMAQLLWTGGLIPLVGGLTAGIVGGIATARRSGAGRVPRHRPLRPAPTAVTVHRVQPSGAPASGAPASLAAALSRIPSGDGGVRVRVERYDLPGGSRAFAVYVTGTRELAGTGEVWDMGSNRRLYGGRDADSIAAVRAAMTASGAVPGDAVLGFGHSQGGMIIDAIAAEGEYRVEVVGTAGSPTSFDAGPDTLSVELRHRDDPVAALADGGYAQRVGAEGSFVAERTVDPLPGVQDVGLEAHLLDAYLETAELVDASGDPRVAELQARLAALADAGEPTVYEYAADAGSPAIPIPAPHVDGNAPPVPLGVSRRDASDAG